MHTACTSMIPVCTVEIALPGHAHHMRITPLSRLQAAAEATSAAPTESLSAAAYSGAGSADIERRTRGGVALASFGRTFKHKKLFVYHKICMYKIGVVISDASKRWTHYSLNMVPTWFLGPSERLPHPWGPIFIDGSQ